MHCEYFTGLMSAVLDGECTPEERRELEAHLAVCPQCAELFDRLSAQSAALRALDCELPAGLTARIMEQLPPQEAPAKRGKVLLWKRWAPVAAAACLALVVALLPHGDQTPDKAVAKDMTAERSDVSTADNCGLADSESNCGSADYHAAVGEPDAYDWRNVRRIRVPYGSTPEAPSARIVGSPEELAACLDCFGAWEQSPELADLAAKYPAEFFADGRLLCAVVEVGSGSYSVELGNLYRDAVEVRIVVPDGFCTADMAAWLIVAEVDSMFDSGDTLSVEISR